MSGSHSKQEQVESKRKRKEKNKGKKGKKAPSLRVFTAVKNKAELEDLSDAGETSNLMCHLSSRIFRRYRQNFQFKVICNRVLLGFSGLLALALVFTRF